MVPGSDQAGLGGEHDALDPGAGAERGRHPVRRQGAGVEDVAVEVARREHPRRGRPDGRRLTLTPG